MYEFYKLKFDDNKLKESRKKLRELYAKIPEVVGCMENIAKENGCGAKCCESQSPSLMYVEFLNTWNALLNGKETHEIAALVIKAVRTYLKDTPTKGCMFHDSKTKLCKIHSTRPQNCRVYAQIPEEEFNPRYERLKVLYENDLRATIMPQCNFCKTQGTKPTKADTDAWQKEIEEIEQSIGIPNCVITDSDGGSYRTFHDHILLKMCSPNFLEDLTKVKLSGDTESKERFVQKLVERMKKSHPLLEDVKDDHKSIIILG